MWQENLESSVSLSQVLLQYMLQFHSLLSVYLCQILVQDSHWTWLVLWKWNTICKCRIFLKGANEEGSLIGLKVRSSTLSTGNMSPPNCSPHPEALQFHAYWKTCAIYKIWPSDAWHVLLKFALLALHNVLLIAIHQTRRSLLCMQSSWVCCSLGKDMGFDQRDPRQCTNVLQTFLQTTSAFLQLSDGPLNFDDWKYMFKLRTQECDINITPNFQKGSPAGEYV